MQSEGTSKMVLPESWHQYDLRAPISHGHSEQVYAAWDTRLCREVWIRRIQFRDDEARQILQSARLVAALKHPAFVKIHAVEAFEEQIFIVGEAVKGTALLDWIENCQADLKSILNITIQIASALSEAHHAGLVLGNLQGHQFVLDASLQVRILNFGFFRGSSVLSLSSTEYVDGLSGLAYCAPERFTNHMATPASDVYALGTLLYQMLNRQLPFSHLQGLAMVAALVQADAEQWTWQTEHPPALRAFVLAMLKRRPDQRISCAEIVERARALREAEGYSASNTSLNLMGLQDQLTAHAKKLRRRHFFITVVLLVTVSTGVWLAQPDWHKIATVLTPYSESKEFERGITALTQHVYNPDPQLLDQAETAFSRILEKQPDNARAVGYMSVLYLSRYHSRQRDEIWLQKAKASAQQAMRLDSELAISLIAQAKIEHWHHRYQVTLDLVEKALQREPKNLLAWHTKMSALFESGRLRDAIEWGQRGAQLFPHDRFLLELKAIAHRTLNDFETAEKDLKTSMTRQPDSVLAYGLLAETYTLQGRRDEAMQVLQKGLQIKPSVSLYENLGALRFLQGDFEGAADAYADAVSPARGVAGSYSRWSRYGEALTWTKSRQNEARQALEKARDLLEIRLKRASDDAYLLIDMALIQVYLGNREVAEKYVSDALGANEDAGYVLFNAGLCFELMGERQRALKVIQKSMSEAEWAARAKDHPALRELRNDLQRAL